MVGLGLVKARPLGFPYWDGHQYAVVVARIAAPLGLAGSQIVVRHALCWPPRCENPIRRLLGIRIADYVAEDADATCLLHFWRSMFLCLRTAHWASSSCPVLAESLSSSMSSGRSLGRGSLASPSDCAMKTWRSIDAELSELYSTSYLHPTIAR